MKNPFLIGKKIYLRPLEIEDSDFICLGENDEKIRDALFLALPMSPSTSKEKIQKQIDAPDTILFTIVLQENETPVGQTGLFRVDFVSRAAVFFLAILVTDYWGTGIGSEATTLVINYAFQTLNLNRIQLHVNAKNTAAIRIYKKIGFQQEGILRQAMYKNEEYFDFLVMGILRSDWESLK